MANEIHSTLVIADYLDFGILAATMVLIASVVLGKTRYKSVDEIPKPVLIRLAVIWFPLALLFVLIQVYRPSTPWLMYVPIPWLYPA